MKKITFFLFLFFFLSCTATPREKPSFQVLLESPKPTTSAELEKQCLAIRMEIIQQRAVARYLAKGVFAAAGQIQAEMNIAELKNRAAFIGCPDTFSSY